MSPRGLILCIEDEEVLRRLIAAELRDAGYEVCEAADGASGLRIASERRPDLVLCDIAMPGADGYDVLSSLRSNHPELVDVPFVFLSAFADRKDVIAGKKLGADDYLTKPVDFEIMHATIEARLRQVAQIRAADEHDRRRARQHFDELLENARRQSFAAGTEALNRLSVGIVLLGDDRNVMFANRAAQDIAHQKDAVLMRHGRLATALPQHASRLDGLVRSVIDPSAAEGAEADQVASIPRLSGARPLLALGISLRGSGADVSSSGGPAALILLSDPERRAPLEPTAISRLYGLTLAEARLAQRLAAGERLDEITLDLGISRNTAVTHLKRVFQKTHTERQSELVALLVAGPLALGSFGPPT
ncbi:MAG: response regulator [Rhodospirillaceae bacterium]|nr:response regulator [Rhodospirillaceae bacterium]